MQLNSTLPTVMPAPQSGEFGSDSESGKGDFLPPVLLQYWYIMLRWKWVIGGVVSASVLLGLIATLLMAPKYTAQVQLEISREQKQITKVEGVESEQSGRDIEFYATQYSLLKTRPIAERVVNTLRLSNNEEFYLAHGLKGILDDPDYRGNAAKQKKLAIDLLLANVNISPVRSSRLVYVGYTSRSPSLSANIANTWARAFIATSMDRQLASTFDARRILLGQLDDLRGKVEQSERRAALYASEKGIVTLDQEKNAEGRTVANRTLAASDLQELNAALNRATEVRIVAQSRAGSSAEAASETISNQALAMLRQQRTEIASDYARVLVQYDPAYPGARQLAEKLKSIDQAIARETSRIGQGRAQEFREAQRRESELRSKVETLKAQLDAQQHAGIQYAIYQRDADTNRQLYDALLQRYKEIGIAGTVAPGNISIVEPAEIPSNPSSPRLLVNLLLSLIFGVFVAGVLAYGLEQIDEGVRSPAQVQSRLGLSILGHTPVIEGTLLEELEDTKSSFYEAYFSVRSNLAFATSHGFPKTLMITSTRPAEGKSSTALALATILGRTGKKVLLIDADMRSPSLHHNVGVSNDSGLSNILAGQDNWKELVQKPGFKSLDVLTAGPIPPSAAELLSSDRIQLLLQDAQTVYDHIIIDSPPVLGLADAPLISRVVEGCVFVVEAGGAATRAIQASVARLKLVNTHVFGVVLTKLKSREGAYGYGYGYGRRYGQSPSDGA